MKLRDYQRKAVSAVSKMTERRVLIVAPTGSGKTVIAADLVKRTGSRRVLWLAHRVELLAQARAQVIAAGVPESQVGMLSGGKYQNEGARVMVASVDSLRTRDVPAADLVVVDEAHRVAAATYQRILSERAEATVYGLTATPQRLDNRPLGDTFERLHVAATMTELFIDGHLAHPVTYGVPKEKAREMVRGLAGKEYPQGRLGEAMMRGHLMGDVVAECKRLAPGRRTLVFAASREHGRALWRRFRQGRRAAEYLDGEAPAKTREAILRRLESGKTQVVVNVDVLSEGFDCPPVQCIALARPTKSLTRYLQQVGRASRPHGDERPVILDHAGNTWRFGLPEAEREWSLDGRDKGEGNTPVKQCEACGAMVPLSAIECPECGAEIVTPEERAEREAELERIQATEREKAAVLERVREVAKERGAPRGWAQQVVEAMWG
jgi:DNA repair protein RadD